MHHQMLDKINLTFGGAFCYSATAPFSQEPNVLFGIIYSRLFNMLKKGMEE